MRREIQMALPEFIFTHDTRVLTSKIASTRQNVINRESEHERAVNLIKIVGHDVVLLLVLINTAQYNGHAEAKEGLLSGFMRR